MQDGQRIRGARLAVDGDEHAATGCEGLENTTIMCLKTDTSQRPGQTQLWQIPSRALNRRDQRASSQQRTSGSGLNALTRAAEDGLDKGGDFRAFFCDDAERFGRETGPSQRLNPFLRPLHVLEHADSESSSLYVNHGDVI